MTMNKELHAKHYVDWWYVSRMEVGKIGCKIFVKAEEKNLEQYIKNHFEPLIVAVRISNTVPSKNSIQPKNV